MKTLSMKKIITVMADGYQPYIIQHGKLAAELANDSEIVAEYEFGQKDHREKQLAKLGYTLKASIHNPDPATAALWSPVKGIWHRAA
jgi:hypothetical protein